MTVSQQDREHEHSEYFWIWRTANEYRARGYKVLLDARLDFLPRFRPDIVAVKGDDKRVVEVKRRTTLSTDRRLDRLARAIETESGWSFDLVLIPEAHQLITPDGSQPLGVDPALRVVGTAERLLHAGYTESSLLAAWAALEAVLRTRLQEETDSGDKASPTRQLVDSATMHGVISHEARKYLKELLPLRNAVAHGMSHVDIEEDAVLNLIEFLRKLSTDTVEEPTPS